MPNRQIFISHSRADNVLVDKVLSHFEGTQIKPIRMEFEEESQGNTASWQWIRETITSSEAVFLILTRNIMGPCHEHTQNWISYEVGVTAALQPQRPLFVFKEDTVRFAVPYLTNYMPYSVIPKLDANWIDDVSKQTFHELLFDVLKAIIENPSAKVPTKIKCPHCKRVSLPWY